MSALGSLVVKLALEYAQFTGGLDKSEQAALHSAKRIQDSMDGLGRRIAATAGAIAGGIAAAFTISAFRGLVDAADQLDDLAEKTGLTASRLSELKYASEAAGTPMESLTKGMKKLSTQMAEAAGGSKESIALFKAMGVSVKDSDGSLRSLDDVMGDVASRFVVYKDGADKVALASALFGEKIGSDLIPLLNRGASGIAELAQEARNMGAVMSDEVAKDAAEFNDNLTKIGIAAKGAAVSIAGPLVKALADASGAFVEAKKNGESYFGMLARGANSLPKVPDLLKGLPGMRMLDLWQQAGSALASQDKFADPRLLGTVGSIAEQTREWNLAAPTLNKAGDSAKAAASAYASLNSTIEQRQALMTAELEGGRKLSETEKFVLETRRKLDDESVKLTASERAGLAVKLSQVEVQGKLYDQQQRDLEWSKQAREENERVAESVFKLSESSQEKLRAQLQENETIGLTAVEVARLEAARLSDAAASQEQRAATLDLIPGMESAAQAARDAAAAMRALGEAKVAGAIKKEQRDLWASIDQTAHDVWVNIFDGGTNVFKKLGQVLKASVLDLLYQMTVKKWIVSIGTSVSGLGAAGSAVAGTGGAGGPTLGAASNLYSAYSTGSSLTTVGSQVAAGTMSLGNAAGTMFANATATGIDGLLATNAAFGTSTAAAGAGSSMMASLAAAGPYVLAAIAIANALGLFKTTKKVGGGIGGAVGDETDLHSYDLMRKSGSLFSGPKYSVRQGSLDDATAQAIQDSVAGLLTQARTQAATLGAGAALASFKGQLGSELIHPDTGGYGIKLDGLSSEQAQQKIQAEVQKLYDTMATQALGEAGKLFVKAGETAGQTLARLSSSLTTTNAWLSMLRQRVFQVGLAGGDAASQLADAFGGLEKLTGAARAFYETYYTEGERAADSQRRMAEALAAVNLALPESKTALRAMAEGLDLNTESGRAAYATLLQLAPEFAATADAQAQLARETAERLLDTFSGRQQLIPLLSATTGGLAALALGLRGTTEQTGLLSQGTQWINRVMLDASSGVLYFGDRVQATAQPLSAAQLAAQGLADEIVDLRLNAERTVIDIAGLAAALTNVDTQTFVATIGLVFERLGERIKGVIGDIASERIATREAALQIVNPAVMTRDQIARGIAAANVGMPGNAGVVAAQARLTEMDRLVAGARATLGGGLAQRDAAATAVAATRGQIDATAGQRDQTSAAWGERQAWFGNVWTNRIGSWDWRMSLHDVYRSEEQQFNDQMTQFADSLGALGNTLAGQQQAYDATRSAAEQYGQQLAALSSGQTDALAAARQAQLAYVASLQTYALDASKAVTKLGRLREETVRYYEAQQRLAELMSSSAAGLRKSVDDYRFAQLTPALQLEQLQTQFGTAYAMALSTSGETLAGYGDRLGGLLGPLLDKAGEVLSGSAYNALVATTLARAETVAGRIEQLTPTDYAADSLALLGQIDTTLAALEEGAKSAERVIADAIKAGADQTSAGLRAVVAAVTGQPIPAFASGGFHAGGLRIVGERGPELEATGPARIWTADQTRAMFNGAGQGNEALVAEVRALRAEVAAMRAERRADGGQTAANTGGMLRQLDRIEARGLQVYGENDQPVYTKAAV